MNHKDALVAAKAAADQAVIVEACKLADFIAAVEARCAAKAVEAAAMVAMVAAGC